MRWRRPAPTMPGRWTRRADSRQGEEPGETVADSLGVQESGFDRAEDRATLQPLLAHISERERLVLRLRFAEGMTQAEIGARIGVSQMQVSRLIRQAIARLRAGLENQPGATGVEDRPGGA